MPVGPMGLHMSVSNRVFHAPHSDTDDRGYLRGKGFFFYIYGVGEGRQAGRVALMRALFLR